MTFDARRVTAVALVVAAMCLVYWQVLQRLVSDAWIVDGNSLTTAF